MSENIAGREENPAPESRLWTPHGFRDDEWVHAETADALAGNSRVILPLAAFLELDPQERALNRERLGVLLQPGDQLDEIAGLLDALSLVALAFPAYNDGRGYSKAELLRSRHGFKGAVRAVGDVLYDQLSHMLRVGFDEFTIANPVLIRRLEDGNTGGLPLHYQPSARSSGATGGYSWRRAGQNRV
jgi:uncharacterized protein (DUF934 family)